MPAQWTAEVIGELHLNRLTALQLAKELGWHPKYLSQVLNGHKSPDNAEAKVRTALEHLKSKEV